MRSVKRGPIITAVLLAPIALVSGCWIVETAQVNAFYQSHDLINTMRLATQDSWPRDPLPLRQTAFYEHIPRGTALAETTRALSSEGFDCRRWNAPPPRSKTAFDCFLQEGTDKVGRWLIQIDFDEQSNLVHANIVILK